MRPSDSMRTLTSRTARYFIPHYGFAIALRERGRETMMVNLLQARDFKHEHHFFIPAPCELRTIAAPVTGMTDQSAKAITS